MNSNNIDASVFILVSLFLLAILALMSLIQVTAWLIVTFACKQTKLRKKSYQTLLQQEQYDIKIAPVKLIAKFTNFKQKTNCLRLTTSNFEEKTLWNIYQNLLSVLLIKWKKANKKTNIILITSTLVYYFSVATTITCALVYYLNYWQGTINNINATLLSILSFSNLVLLVVSWLIWTMTYEKIRKELIELATILDNPKVLKSIKLISSYKTLFPGSELLF